MPLSPYGMLVGRARARSREGAPDDSPHYQVHVRADGVDYRIAVNVRSALAPSELLYLVDDGFDHPALPGLADAPEGWTALASRPGGGSLDYIRGNLFDPGAMRLLPPDVPGADNDLADVLDHWLLRAIAEPDARVHAFGVRWGPDAAAPDPVFGFEPGNGVHDIHMNQGNSGRFRRDDGVFQDGGLVLHYPGTARWVALFLAFQSQSWHTDDTTGHAIPEGPPPARAAAAVRVVAAMVNPAGPAPEAESVTLLNASPAEVDLTGWRLADAQASSCPVPPVRLAPGATVVVPVAEPVRLGNAGGAITLLDPTGLKVDGVAYTADQCSTEGWTVVF